MTSPSTTTPLVSIGLPVLDGAGALRRALDDLLAQTWPAVEITVSDNASSDATFDIATSYAREHKTVRVLRQPRRLGPQHHFAAVFDVCDGDFFMWAAHDDMWDATYVERLVVHLLEDPDVDLAAGVPTAVGPDRIPRGSWPAVASLAAPTASERVMRFLAQPEPEGKANLIYGVFRRSALADVAPGHFWACDERRLDYHLLLATVARGRLVIDPEVAYLKSEGGVGDLRGRFRKLRAARQGWRWLAAYDAVVDELPIPASTRKDAHALLRRRRREFLLDGARRALLRRSSAT